MSRTGWKFTSDLRGGRILPVQDRSSSQSNPVQVLLCVIVLLDAGIVIAQILLDLNSVKGNFRYRRRSSCRTDHILIEIGAQFQ